MSSLNTLKSLIPEALKKRIKVSMGFKSMEGRMQNLARAGFFCTGAVDVGAYHGEWAKVLRSVWNVPVVLVEPQLACKPALEEYARNPGAAALYPEYCALGNEVGTVDFLTQETNSRVAQSGEHNHLPSISVPIKTLKTLMSAYPERYNLLKADVQGFELEVLDGAGDTLQQFEVVILEVSIIRIGPAPTFYEVMQYMDRKGYRLYDFLPMYYRPRDQALWQGDAFFVRNDSTLVASLSWD